MDLYVIWTTTSGGYGVETIIRADTRLEAVVINDQALSAEKRVASEREEVMGIVTSVTTVLQYRCRFGKKPKLLSVCRKKLESEECLLG